MTDYKLIEERYQQLYLDSLSMLYEPEKTPKNEEEQLQEFIRDYINEVKPEPQGWNLQQFAAMYGGMAARQMGKSNLFHQLYEANPKLIIQDESSYIKEWTWPERIILGPTPKPTKKQAKLLRKFRKLKRFK